MTIEFEKLRDLAAKSLARAQAKAVAAEEAARRDPFNGAVIHAAVDARGQVRGFEEAMSVILGAIEATRD